MPVNRKYPLAVLLEACRYYHAKKKQKLTFEYILIDGINDTEEQARALVGLAAGLEAKVNLIPYNTVEGLDWTRPPLARQQAFQNVLRTSGVSATLRREKGHDIDCQLAVSYGGRRWLKISTSRRPNGVAPDSRLTHAPLKFAGVFADEEGQIQRADELENSAASRVRNVVHAAAQADPPAFVKAAQPVFLGRVLLQPGEWRSDDELASRTHEWMGVDPGSGVARGGGPRG